MTRRSPIPQLDLRLRSHSDGLLVSAGTPGTGEASDTTRLPEPAAMQRQREALVRALGSSRRDFTAGSEPARGREGAQERARELGTELFAALFGRRVRALYEGLRARGEGLRLRLIFDSWDPAIARLCGLPWECLFDDCRRQFLLLEPGITLVRHLAVGQPGRVLSLRPPLRLLAVASSHGPQLDLAAELRCLEKLRQRGRLSLELLTDPSPPLLWSALSRRFDVFHFLGHGGLDERGSGVLHLAGAPLRGDALARVFGGKTSPPLVVLNACDSGTFGTGAPDPMASLAAELVSRGVPAVVAMQWAISDPGAVAFSKAFYEALAASRPVEAAVAEGRTSLLRSAWGDEWMTPVLYSRPVESLPVVLDPPSSGSDRIWPAVAPSAAALACIVVGLSYRVRELPPVPLLWLALIPLALLIAASWRRTAPRRRWQVVGWSLFFGSLLSLLAMLVELGSWSLVSSAAERAGSGLLALPSRRGVR
ncbi:MAG TPA: CHAT domain-containing protein [Thermoanaerobaculia bacterium]|nr:CHAT domain-containing protein [Thermoanaerobaculia bacterium]